MRTDLLLVDAHAVAYRAFYIRPDQVVKVASKMLSGLTEEANPRHMIAVFEGQNSARSWRHKLYPQYKANRSPMPDQLRESFPDIEAEFGKLGFTICRHPDYEADDVIGSLVEHAERAGWDALISTGDRDLFQLISPSTRVVVPGQSFSDRVYFDLFTMRDSVKYGFDPRYMVTYKVLVGDTSDNIPGVPGIGDTWAKKLIGTYGSIQDMLACLSQIQPARFAHKLSESRELINRNIELVTIKRDVAGLFEYFAVGSVSSVPAIR
jgi:DNA polymerase-1